MLHKATERKLPKKYDNRDKEEKQQQKKESSKPLMRAASNAIGAIGPNRNMQRQASVKNRVSKVEKKIENIAGKFSNNQLQTLLIQQIKGIKNQLKQIKQHIGIQGNNQKASQKIHQHYEQQQQQQNIYNENIHNIQQNDSQNYSQNNKNKSNHYSKQPVVHSSNNKKMVAVQNEQPETPRMNANYKLYQKPKQLIEIGKIQPYMKQFKVQVTKNMLPYYHGYHKKSSKAVIIKYCAQNKSMEPIFNLYQKLWKNIVKAKNICINKVYDLNQPLATYILVIQANKYSLSELLNNRVATVPHILCTLIKALRFFHQCGYLYRNIHPHHVMGSYENDIVLIDLKNMKRFVDIKGKHTNVTRDTEQIQDQFVSNCRARGLREGRKDDLQSLGYLALFILQGSLPWTINNLVQVRSKLTLKQLCGKFSGLLEYMIIISQMQTQDVPDYEKLIQILSTL